MNFFRHNSEVLYCEGRYYNNLRVISLQSISMIIIFYLSNFNFFQFLEDSCKTT